MMENKMGLEIRPIKPEELAEFRRVSSPR